MEPRIYMLILDSEGGTPLSHWLICWAFTARGARVTRALALAVRNN